MFEFGIVRAETEVSRPRGDDASDDGPGREGSRRERAALPSGADRANKLVSDMRSSQPSHSFGPQFTPRSPLFIACLNFIRIENVF